MTECRAHWALARQICPHAGPQSHSTTPLLARGAQAGSLRHLIAYALDAEYISRRVEYIFYGVLSTSARLITESATKQAEFAARLPV